MYETILVFSDAALSYRISSLSIWGKISNFRIGAVEYDGAAAYEQMKRRRYDLALVQTELNGMNGFQLLRRAKQENLCAHIVLYSEFFDYGRARQSIIGGAFDYFWRDCSANLLLSVFQRVKGASALKNGARHLKREDILIYFDRRDSDLHKALPAMLDELYFSSDTEQAKRSLRAVYESTVAALFKNNDWLKFYIDENGLLARDSFAAQQDFKSFCCNNLLNIFDTYCELFPKINNSQFKDVLLFILRHPEGDLRQKTIAADLYMNSSFLSIMFTSQLQRRFIDYLTAVKFHRACCLLKQTSLPIGEIASKLDYKDTGYFSQLFKKRCGMTPSEYRIPDGYDYQI